MLNIDGLVKITKIEDMSDKASKACIYFGNKKSKDSDEYENSFFNAVLVGDAFKKVANVEDKTKIYVTKGIVKNVSYEGKDKKQHSYLSLTIFDFTADEQEINDILQSQGFKTEPTKEEKPQRRNRSK